MYIYIYIYIYIERERDIIHTYIYTHEMEAWFVSKDVRKPPGAFGVM